MESIEKILANLGAADIDSKLEEALIDGILYAFQEQTTEVSGLIEILILISYFIRNLLVTIILLRLKIFFMYLYVTRVRNDYFYFIG